MHAREIYERIQRNIWHEKIRDSVRIQMTADRIVDELCGGTGLGPYIFRARDFPAYDDGFASNEDVVEKLQQWGLIATATERGVVVTVPEPKAEETK